MIDNTKYYNAALAYDFEMFMEKPKKERPDNIIKMKPAPKKRLKPKKNVFVFIGIGVMLVYLFLNIQMRVSINELNGEVYAVQKEIEELEAEKTALEMKIAQTISYENISQRAVELGMVKATKDKIIYIRTNDKNKAVDKNGKEIYSKKSN